MRNIIATALLALILASAAWAGEKIRVSSLHFAMELPGGWVEQGAAKGVRKSLAKSASEGKPFRLLKDRTELAYVTLTKNERDPRNPRLKVTVFQYGDIGKRDVLRVAKEWTEKNLGRPSDDVRNIEIAEPVEVTLNGSAAAKSVATAAAKDRKSGDWVDVQADVYVAVFDEYFIVVSAIHSLDESEVVLADMQKAIESIRLD
jgi:hypothetical protein